MLYESNANIRKFRVMCKKCLHPKVEITELDYDNRFIKIICEKCKLEDYIKIK